MGESVTVEALKAEGNAFFAKEEWRAAEEVYSRAIVRAKEQIVDPKLLATVLSNRSVSWAMLENYEAALEDAERVVELRPDWARGYARKAVALIGKNNLQAAQETVEQGQKVDGQDSVLQDIAAQLMQDDDEAAAESEALEDAISFADALAEIKAAGVQSSVWVVVLSGFLGAGKTTLLKQILTQNQGQRRFAVFVNDMAEINIDADLIQHQHSFSEVREELVELTNGCVCCTLRGDLIKEATRLLCLQKFDGIVIEATGISEPMPVAATFVAEDSDGRSLKEYFKIDNMVTLIDASQFLEMLEQPTLLKDQQLESEEGDSRSIAQLLMDQVEFADTLVLNKCDLVSEQKQNKIHALLQQLNASAKILSTTHSQVDLSEILEVHRFKLDEAEGFDGFATELITPHVSETEEYGVASWVLKSPVPFHPVRLHTLLFGDDAAEDEPLSPGIVLKSVFRSKGVFYLASELDCKVAWSTAGPLAQFDVVDRWLAAIPPEERENESEVNFHPLFGDRAQELVFIAKAQELPQVRSAIEACLLTANEIERGASYWSTLDPAKLWQFDEDDED